MYIYELFEEIAEVDYSQAIISSVSTGTSTQTTDSTGGTASIHFGGTALQTIGFRGGGGISNASINQTENGPENGGTTQNQFFDTVGGLLTSSALISDVRSYTSTEGPTSNPVTFSSLTTQTGSSSGSTSFETLGTILAPTFGGSYTFTVDTGAGPETTAGNTTTSAPIVSTTHTVEAAVVDFTTVTSSTFNDAGHSTTYSFETTTDGTITVTRTINTLGEVDTYGFSGPYETTTTVNVFQNLGLKTVVEEDGSFDAYIYTGGDGAQLDCAVKIGDEVYLWEDYNEISAVDYIPFGVSESYDSGHTGTIAVTSTSVAFGTTHHASRLIVRQDFFAMEAAENDTRTETEFTTSVDTYTFPSTTGTLHGPVVSDDSIATINSYTATFVVLVPNTAMAFATARKTGTGTGFDIFDFDGLTTSTSSGVMYSIGVANTVVDVPVSFVSAGVGLTAQTVFAKPKGIVMASRFGLAAGIVSPGVFGGLETMAEAPAEQGALGCMISNCFGGFNEGTGLGKPTVFYMDAGMNGISGASDNLLPENSLSKFSFGLPSIYGSSDDEFHRFDTALNAREGLSACIGFTGKFPLACSITTTQSTSTTSQPTTRVREFCIATARYASKQSSLATLNLTFTYTTSTSTNTSQPDSITTITDKATATMALHQAIAASKALMWGNIGSAFGANGNFTEPEFAQFVNCVVKRTINDSTGGSSTSVDTVTGVASASAGAGKAVVFESEMIVYKLDGIKRNSPVLFQLPRYQPDHIFG